MSHNILTLNNNSFDVNSNRTESISSSNYSYVYPTGGAQPLSLSVGSNFLFKKDVQVNASTSWITQIDHATQTGYVEKFRFIQDGTYRIRARAVVAHNAFATAGNRQGFQLYDLTNSQFISSAFYLQYNDNAYCFCNYMSSIVVRSGSNIDVSLRCTYIGNLNLSSGLDSYAILTAEKLQ